MKSYPYDIRKKWPFHYDISALYFFALDVEYMPDYLTEEFSDTVFHCSGGDFASASPLVAITTIYTDIIHTGIHWNYWIGATEYEDDELQVMFSDFCDKLEKLDVSEKFKDINYFAAPCENHVWGQAMGHCQDAATAILKRIGWYDNNHLTPMSCERVLDEYSYGAFQLNRAKKKCQREELQGQNRPPWELCSLE